MIHFSIAIMFKGIDSELLRSKVVEELKKQDFEWEFEFDDTEVVQVPGEDWRVFKLRDIDGLEAAQDLDTQVKELIVKLGAEVNQFY